MRTIIELPDEQVQALDAACRRDGISRAEAIRRAVAQHLQATSRAEAKRAFGLWRGQALDGLKYERKLRREWDR